MRALSWDWGHWDQYRALRWDWALWDHQRDWDGGGRETTLGALGGVRMAVGWHWERQGWPGGGTGSGGGGQGLTLVALGGVVVAEGVTLVGLRVVGVGRG